ncbi:1,2-phenylacetyl-CoA epoxidase subunit PaaE [Streptacidiphilus monticola]|uniref:1,2-phenylacetyl-CoA epoxidase subunit PaaE n=1 Tax=Streptacidiphilus monticola TaxID=2161674 RepID=A0ABW1FZB6_9ACTN
MPGTLRAGQGAVTVPEFLPLRVAAVEPLCADAVAVTFDAPAEEYRFRAGQSLTIRRLVDGREERRSYSICAPEGGPLRIGVREVPGGLFSSWLVRDVRPGDVVEALPPLGLFTPDLSRPAHHALVAAGSGITPLLSIAATALADGESRVTLFYGNRRSDTVMFADELADLKDRYPARFQLVHVLSREPREAELLTGRIDGAHFAALLDALVDVADVDHWWLCGPLGMVEDARKVLAEAGVPGDRVHRELFFAEEGDAPEPLRHEEPEPTGPSVELTVRLDGRESSLAVPADALLLDAAQAARPDLPFACKGGVCGTCRAKVVEGTVHMRRNFALEREEVDAGYVLTCQARATSDCVTLSFDE